ncbi:MAG: acyl-CoA thioesterase [Acidimicrobiales bacterium]
MSYDLDRDTDLSAMGEGRYRGRLSDRWNIGGGMNGGYLAAFCLRAAMAVSTFPDPLSLSVHYLSRPVPGAADVVVELLRAGRGHATASFRLLQGGPAGARSGPGKAHVVRCAGLVTFGRLRAPGRLDFQPEAPEVPAPLQCRPVSATDGFPNRLWKRLEVRLAAPGDLFALRSAPGEAQGGGWMRLGDGRPPDALSAALLLDSWPPVVLSRTMHPDPSGAPTLEYSVHFRNRAASPWLYARLETLALAGGYLDEHGALFDESGVLVAESRQLARYSAGGAG